MPEFAVAVEDAFKTYGSGQNAVDALRGVTIRVKPGEIYGLLGRNGAGKTTLVKSLLDIVRLTKGNVSILEVTSRQPAARVPVGYLPEDHRFPDYRTGEGVLHFYAGLSGLSATEQRTRVPHLLELTGLKDAAKRKVRGYSKGMKQRLGLAQALVHNPQVLFLDEPTDGVDPVGRAQIRDVLHGLQREGKTIFLNSHLLSEVEQLCDRIGIMEKGKLVREGTLESLTTGGCAYTLTTSAPLDASARQAVAEIALAVTDLENAYVIKLKCDAEVDHIVDALRARQVGIRGLELRRMSLEEVFMQVVDTKAGETN